MYSLCARQVMIANSIKHDYRQDCSRAKKTPPLGNGGV
jgi:hypothetical protein